MTPNMEGEINMVTAHAGSRERTFTPPLPDLIIDASAIMITVQLDLTLLDGPKLSNI